MIFYMILYDFLYDLGGVTEFWDLPGCARFTAGCWPVDSQEFGKKKTEALGKSLTRQAPTSWGGRLSLRPFADPP